LEKDKDAMVFSLLFTIVLEVLVIAIGNKKMNKNTGNKEVLPTLLQGT
jgi:hypothetical protein